MKPRHGKILGMLGALAILATVGWAWLGEAGDRAPAARFETLAGEQFQLASLRGHPVIVYFWATDCVTCMREMPDIVELHDELSGRGLELIAVAMSHDTVENVRSVKRERELPFPVVLDRDGEHARAFREVRVTPTKFLIGPEGRIRMRHIGTTDYAQLRRRIENLLES